MGKKIENEMGPVVIWGFSRDNYQHCDSRSLE